VGTLPDAAIYARIDRAVAKGAAADSLTDADLAATRPTLPESPPRTTRRRSVATSGT
jgi:hypothetical protein